MTEANAHRITMDDRTERVVGGLVEPRSGVASKLDELETRQGATLSDDELETLVEQLDSERASASADD